MWWGVGGGPTDLQLGEHGLQDAGDVGPIAKAAMLRLARMVQSRSKPCFSCTRVARRRCKMPRTPAC
jgi:hypothetical protein